jgi:tetratricopeptide (TPR) repeat protein
LTSARDRHLIDDIMTGLAVVLVCALLQTGTQGLAAAEARRAERHNREGWRHLDSGDHEEAAREFAAAVRLNERYADALHGLGKAQMALKQYAAAVEAYERCRAVYQASGSAAAETRTASNRMREHQIRELQQRLSDLQTQPQQLTTASLRDEIRELQRQIRDLEHTRERGDLVEPAGAVPAFLSLALGSAYFRTSQLPAAEKMFLEAIASQPKFGEAHSNLALVLLVTGRPQDAARHVRLAEEAGFRVNPELKRRIAEAGGVGP